VRADSNTNFARHDQDEALGNLRNVLGDENRDLDRLGRDTAQRYLAEASARGRVYDQSIASGLARTFVSLIRDRMKTAVEETKRIFSMPGMPVDDSTKAGVKTILSDLQNQLVELAQRSLDGLAERHPTTPKPGPIASEAAIKSLAMAWPSEIDLLFSEAERRAATERRARNAAIISIIGAAATWAGVIIQYYHPKPTTTPASPTPALATPSPTQAPSPTPT
jgi:hypothetical protein